MTDAVRSAENNGVGAVGPGGAAGFGARGGLPAAYTALGSSSFLDFVGAAAPALLPGSRALPAGSASDLAPHGTTIIAATFAGGALIAGDRRATMANVVAQRDTQKVYVTDTFSAVGIAGAAGIAIEMVRLFGVELEHYEKIQGTPLSLTGKANRLSTMVRSNLGAAMQGLAVLPLLVGFEPTEEGGRIFSYDATGGSYEERDYHSIGSGSPYARGALKKRWRPDLDADAAVRVAIDALYDAADDDTATGGPDLIRRLYPSAILVTADGATHVSDEQIAAVAERVVADRHERPGG